jgi:hypothetical protein
MGIVSRMEEKTQHTTHSHLSFVARKQLRDWMSVGDCLQLAFVVGRPSDPGKQKQVKRSSTGLFFMEQLEIRNFHASFVSETDAGQPSLKILVNRLSSDSCLLDCIKKIPAATE